MWELRSAVKARLGRYGCGGATLCVHGKRGMYYVGWTCPSEIPGFGTCGCWCTRGVTRAALGGQQHSVGRREAFRAQQVWVRVALASWPGLCSRLAVPLRLPHRPTHLAAR